jgi:hypothetical protein
LFAGDKVFVDYNILNEKIAVDIYVMLPKDSSIPPKQAEVEIKVIAREIVRRDFVCVPIKTNRI